MRLDLLYSTTGTAGKKLGVLPLFKREKSSHTGLLTGILL